MFTNRVPTLRNPNIHIRVASTRAERDAADRLVFHNYVAEGFWKPDIEVLSKNKNLNSPHRVPFVIVENDKIIGTASLIVDSAQGLPSDDFQPALVSQLRDTGDTLGEISCLAIDKAYSGRGRLIFFLIKYYLQYSFYYAGVDRLIKACKPEHAEFYANILKFDRIGPITFCDYARRPSQLLSMNLFNGHYTLQQCYGKKTAADSDLYRFLLVDEHPNLDFPTYRPRRARDEDWPANFDKRRLKPARTPNAQLPAARMLRPELESLDRYDSALI